MLYRADPTTSNLLVCTCRHHRLHQSLCTASHPSSGCHRASAMSLVDETTERLSLSSNRSSSSRRPSDNLEVCLVIVIWSADALVGAILQHSGKGPRPWHADVLGGRLARRLRRQNYPGCDFVVLEFSHRCSSLCPLGPLQPLTVLPTWKRTNDSRFCPHIWDGA